MLQEARELQQNAVASLMNIIDTKRDIYFKAPTGSGKTYMMADFMNRVISSHPETVFIVSSLSKGDLAKQNYSNFEIYSGYVFNKLNPFLINSDSTPEERITIDVDYNVYVLPRDLYKDKSNLKDSGSFVAFLDELKRLGKRIYLIKDECHIATENLDSLTSYFKGIINFSATPNLSRNQIPDVVLDEKTAVEAKLIKSVKYMEYLDEFDNEKSLHEALLFFEEEKKRYLEKTGIAPCMIIQISNKDKAEEEWATIKKVLEKKHSGLKWMLIVNKSGTEDSINCDTNDQIKVKKVPVSRWKDFAKDNTSTIDIIIFKMVISEGWDIPRACMLYQIRDTKSKQLDEQVIGRVRRNPQLMKFDKEHEDEWAFTMSAYVWGIKPKDRREKVVVTTKETFPAISYELEVKTTVLSDLEEKKGETNRIINTVLDKETAVVSSPSIFSLYRNYSKIDDEVKDGCSAYVLNNTANDEDANQIWLAIMRNSEWINSEFTKYYCDYSRNMKLASKVALPAHSSYDNNTSYTSSIEDWIWIKKDNPADVEFSFDSSAEKAWADKLQSLARKKNSEKMSVAYSVEDTDEEEIYLWGKNYTDNSEIRYQYFLHGIHNSYPDFVLKDSFGRIHLFEVKSVNLSSSMNIDLKTYQEKVLALKECYKFASSITGYDFWLPIQNGSDWDIYHYRDSKEDQLSFEEFKEYMKTKP